MADIIYNIDTNNFFGTVGNYSFDSYAESMSGFITPMLARAHKKYDNRIPSLPLGLYILEYDESKKDNWIVLKPATSTMTYNRSGGFAIHGAGLHGSDSCIVPKDFSIVQKLYELTKEYAGTKQQITLAVKGSRDYNDDYFEWLEKDLSKPIG